MKRMLALLAILICTVSAARAEPKAVALLIGINRYEHCPSLEGCWNDVQLMKYVLTTRFGFPPDRIVELGGPQAVVTRQQIMQAIDQLAQHVDADTTVVFYYSGHGTRIPQAGSASGYVSAIVPADAPLPDSDEAGFMKSVITSRDLEAPFARISGATPRFWAIFDSCHSGSLARDNPLRRAHAREIVFNPKKTVINAAAESSGWMSGRPRYTLLAACRQDEVAMEDETESRVQGRFTRALAEALLAPQALSGGALIDRVRLTLAARNQNPQLEGPLTQGVFTDPAPGPDAAAFRRDWFLVTALEGRRITINGGRLHGLSKGDELRVSGAETPARIDEVGPFSATATLSAAPRDVQRSGWRVYVTAAHYGDARLRVALRNAGLRAALPASEILHVVEDAPDVLLAAGEHGGFDVIADDAPLERDVPASKLAAVLERLARRKMVLALYNRANPQAPIRLDVHALVRASDAAASGVRQTSESADYRTLGVLPRTAGGAWKLHPGQTFAVRMTNESDHDTWYVTLLDVTPDGHVTVQYPSLGSNVEDNTLAPHAFFDVNFAAEDTPGREVFVVLATRKPVDLSYVVTRDIRFKQRNLDDPLARILQSALAGKRDLVLISTDGWSATQLPVLIER